MDSERIGTVRAWEGGVGDEGAYLSVGDEGAYIGAVVGLWPVGSHGHHLFLCPLPSTLPPPYQVRDLQTALSGAEAALEGLEDEVGLPLSPQRVDRTTCMLLHTANP